MASAFPKLVECGGVASGVRASGERLSSQGLAVLPVCSSTPLPQHTHTYQLGCCVIRKAGPDPAWQPSSFPPPAESLCPLHLGGGGVLLLCWSSFCLATSHSCRQRQLKRLFCTGCDRKELIKTRANKNPSRAAKAFVPCPAAAQAPKEDLDGPGRRSDGVQARLGSSGLVGN